jgi:hypothetical protein
MAWGLVPGWWNGWSVGGTNNSPAKASSRKPTRDPSYYASKEYYDRIGGRPTSGQGKAHQFLNSPTSNISTSPQGQTGGPSGDPYAAALAAQRAAAAKAAAEAAAAKRRAGERAQNQAANLDPQIAALKHALEVSFKQGLDQNLTDVGMLLEEQTGMLKDQAAERGEDFLNAGKNTEMATEAQREDSMANLVRERQDTMTAVLQQGAGQTDALRALMGAARNWRSNTQEGNRAYFDTMQSINQNITDLNADTQTALGNVHTQSESEKERLWQDYYNRRSETFTQLGNLYQTQADYLEQAKEMEVGGGGGEKKSSAGDAFMKASEEAGKSYVKQGLPDWIKDYEGTEKIEAKVSNTNLAAGPRFKGVKRARGAGLRSWAA